MLLRELDIQDDTLVSDIVAKDFRTSSVFRKYGIEFGCHDSLSLAKACNARGVDLNSIRNELQGSARTISIPSSIDFKSWNVDFLIDYIRNIHHIYLIRSLPEITELLENFALTHNERYEWLPALVKAFRDLKKVLLPHLEHEEQVIFPYIRQIAHAYERKEPYAALLVRTLRKPVEEMMHREHERVNDYLLKVRKLTNNYQPHPEACVMEKVCLYKLEELDNDLVQHTDLENNILFPRAIAMEKELLLAGE